MMREFNLQVSVQFKGGEYYDSFTADSYEEFVQILKDAWFSTGLHPSTGEMFVFCSIDAWDEAYEFEVGYFRVQDDELTGMFSFPTPGSREDIVCRLLNVDLESIRDDQEQMFEAVVRAIFHENRSWVELVKDDLGKVMQALENEKETEKVARNFYQCVSCDWVGSSFERKTHYFDWNGELEGDAHELRDRMNKGPDSDKKWVQSGYSRVCPKCQQPTQVTLIGAELFYENVQQRRLNRFSGELSAEFKSIKNGELVWAIDLEVANEEARLSCHPSLLYEVIRIYKLRALLEEMMRGDKSEELFSTEPGELPSIFKAYDAVYIEVFLESLGR